MITKIDNGRFIAKRLAKVIESERKLQESAIKLSLFYRTISGEPIVPDPAQLPTVFPTRPPIDRARLGLDIQRALGARPEIRELDLKAEKVRVELEQAENSMLPQLDAQMLASKDVGAETSSSGDKTPFELEVGLYGEVPLQRRKARGKIETARGKLSQIQTKREFCHQVSSFSA